MTHQAKATQFSLLLHIVIVFGVMLSSRYKAPEIPPLLIDFSIVASKAAAGETAGEFDSKQQQVPASTSPAPAEPFVESKVDPETPVENPQINPRTKRSPTKLVREKGKRHIQPTMEKVAEILPQPDIQERQAELRPTIVADMSTFSDADGEGNKSAIGGGTSTDRQLTEAGQQTGGGQDGDGGSKNYDFEYIRELIVKNLTFPATARRRGLAGKIVVSFLLKGNGRVEDVAVIESSGHEILDKNVVATILRIAPFPEPSVPAQLILPITFHLKK